TINEKLNAVTKDIEEYQSKISEYTTTISKNKETISVVESILDKYINRDSKAKDLHELEVRLQEISNSVKAIEDAIKSINDIKSRITDIGNELNPSTETRDKMRFSLDRLKEYKEELSKYQTNYDLIELIKKYSSPTKGGIQNLFIQVYMGQTLNIANSLLRMLFNGTLVLDDYVINDKEFRIPCKSLESPIVNDDISSCSTAQKCMISMILSF